jgi:hypothetical protein
LTLCVCAGFFFEPDFNACLKLFFVPLYAATRQIQVLLSKLLLYKR